MNILDDYIFQAEHSYDLQGDLSRFFAVLCYQYDVYGNAPRGPYQRPRDYIQVGIPIPTDAPPSPSV